MSGRTPSAARTPGTPSIIMSPDPCPWTQIRLGAGTPHASPAPCPTTGGSTCLESQRLCLVSRPSACSGSLPASRSFILAALRALHLDPGCGPPPPSTGRNEDKQTTNNQRIPTFTGVPNTDKEYVRNRCCKAPQRYTDFNLVDMGRERRIPRLESRELPGPVKPVSGKAAEKVCGVTAARPQGQSRAPPRSSESQ